MAHWEHLSFVNEVAYGQLQNPLFCPSFHLVNRHKQSWSLQILYCQFGHRHSEEGFHAREEGTVYLLSVFCSTWYASVRATYEAGSASVEGRIGVKQCICLAEDGSGAARWGKIAILI